MDDKELAQVVWRAYEFPPCDEPDSLDALYDSVNFHDVGDGLFVTLVSEVYEGVQEGSETAVLKRLDDLIEDIRNVRSAVDDYFLEQTAKGQPTDDK